MAARGQIAKNYVEDMIKKAFGKDFVGISDKKLYVVAPENGEKIQIAITLTCPKTPVAIGADSKDDYDFERDDSVAKPQIEFTQEERDTVAELMRELGL